MQPVAVWADNYSYVILADSAKKTALVVDPGEGDAVQKKLRSLGCSLDMILVTHHHADHVSGIEQLCSERAVEVVTHVSDMGRVPYASVAANDGQRFTVGSLSIEVLHVPGHTLGHVAYRIENRLFTGDTLFLGGCGRLFEGTAEDLHTSLCSKIRVLPDSLQIFPGHEYTVRTRSFCLSVDSDNALLREKLQEAKSLRARNLPTVPGDLLTEKLTNVFLRPDVPEVVASVRRLHPGSPGDPLSIFGQLRAMMDSY